MTDTELKIKGLDVLINTLGEVEAERFISLILREPFDYTHWQKKLWVDDPIEELSKAAMRKRSENGTL